MRYWQLWALLIALLGGAGLTSAQTNDELQTELKAMRALLAEQQSRLDQLEEQRSNKLEQDRQDIVDILSEMDMDRQPNDLRLYWKDGLRMDSADGNFKLKFGGRLQYDLGFISGGDLEGANGIGSLEDGAEVRRARLYFEGTMYKDIDFKLQFDFAGGDADLKDAYLNFRNIPTIGNIRVGHFKEPFSLEELTSSKYITFMERSLANTLAPGRNLGIMATNHMLDERMTWATGLFYQVDDFGDAERDGGYAFTSRITALPWYEDDGKKLLHLGAAYSLRGTDGDDNTFRYRSRPEAHFTERFTDTGDFGADLTNLFGFESALVCGPFSLQGEYTGSAVSGTGPGMDDPMFNSFYVQGSYFLTGEHRPYDTKTGVFKRVKPKRNFRQDGGWGAFEATARYSYLDLRNGGLPDTARQVQDVTLGLNWYLNPNIRFMGNYIYSMVDGSDVSDAANIFMLRMQFDF